jgi:hypothetical protein
MDPPKTWIDDFADDDDDVKERRLGPDEDPIVCYADYVYRILLEHINADCPG